MADAGIPIAPFEVVDPDDEPVDRRSPGRCVVKLGDVAHRTEHGAVLFGVDAHDVCRGGGDAAHASPQPTGSPPPSSCSRSSSSHGEVFIGLTGASELGPMVAFGLGGVFVEVLQRVSGRLAPFVRRDAEEMIAEFDDLGGRRRFPRQSSLGPITARRLAGAAPASLPPAVATGSGRWT